MNLLRANDKLEFDNFAYELIYRSSRDGLGREICIDKVYDKANILVITETEGNNVCGEFTSIGWRKEDANKTYTYTKDTKSFIFSIRSSEGYKPCISNVKEGSTNFALAYYPKGYCMFGISWTLNIWNNDCVYHYPPSTYHPLPESMMQLLGKVEREKIKELEIYQLD